MRVPVLPIALACVACVACDPLVGSDYPGEPLLRLQGILTAPRSTSSSSSSDGKAAVLWQSASLWGVTDFTRLPLRIEFPSFWVDILARPGDGALFHVDPEEPPIAEAYLHLIRSDAAAMARADDFLATDHEHVLVYVAGALPPDGMTASYLGGPLAPGFHIVNRTEMAELTPPQRTLAARCIALASGVALDRATASCTAMRLYRLAPTPDDTETVLQFHAESPRS